MKYKWDSRDGRRGKKKCVRKRGKEDGKAHEETTLEGGIDKSKNNKRSLFFDIKRAQAKGKQKHTKKNPACRQTL